MKKVVYTNPLNFEYHAEHKGAHFLIDNEKWANAGELTESIMKCKRGLEYRVNPTTSYDNGSDIESEFASVKSGGASLACIYSEDKNEILDIYFANVHSKVWYYGVLVEDIMTEYHMDKAEFKNFLMEFGVLSRESKSTKKKLRIKKTSSKMIKWFEDRI